MYDLYLECTEREEASMLGYRSVVVVTCSLECHITYRIELLRSDVATTAEVNERLAHPVGNHGYLSGSGVHTVIPSLDARFEVVQDIGCVVTRERRDNGRHERVHSQGGRGTLEVIVGG